MMKERIERLRNLATGVHHTADLREAVSELATHLADALEAKPATATTPAKTPAKKTANAK